MECPKCKTTHPAGSSYCTSCGQLFKQKTNKWLIFSTVFFAALMIVFIILTIYYVYERLNTSYKDLEWQESRLNDQYHHLRDLAPKTYKVTGSTAPCYVWRNGTLIKTEYYYRSGTIIVIYATKNKYRDEEYGLTECGWVLMDNLKRY